MTVDLLAFTEPTGIARLSQLTRHFLIIRVSERQTAFPSIGIVGKIGAFARRLIGLSFAGGTYHDISRGYQFIVGDYREGNRIYMNGFSHGAFCVRSITGC